jgi:hypothetical protein
MNKETKLKITKYMLMPAIQDELTCGCNIDKKMAGLKWLI